MAFIEPMHRNKPNITYYTYLLGEQQLVSIGSRKFREFIILWVPCNNFALKEISYRKV